MTVDPIAFEIFGLQIRWYGMITALSLIIGFVIVYFIAKYRNEREEEVLNFAPFAIIFSILGARLLHVVVNWSYYFGYFPLSKSLINIINIRSGGLAIQGAILGGILTLIVFAKIRKLNFWLWSDILITSFPLGQAIGRWGNYFNQEAFGRPTSLPWGIFIEPANRPYDYVSYEYFHPTFFYESIANLVLFALLMLMHMFYRNRPGKMPYGLILSMYLGIYAVYRTFIEYYRIDSTYFGLVKVVYIINFIALIAALVIANQVIKKFREKKIKNNI